MSKIETAEQLETLVVERAGITTDIYHLLYTMNYVTRSISSDIATSSPTNALKETRGRLTRAVRILLQK